MSDTPVFSNNALHLDHCLSTGELPPATKLVQPHSNLAASQPGQAPSTTSSLADTAPVSRGPPGMDGDTAVQLVQVASAEQHPPASTPTEAAVADIAPLSSDNRPILAASPAKSAQPFASAATPAAAPLPKGLKVAPPISPHSAMRQRLQQSRARVESSMQQQQVQLSDLPVAYAVSTLAQPGPMFIKSFPETSPDSSTMLPESHRTLAYSQASTAGQFVSPSQPPCTVSLPARE